MYLHTNALIVLLEILGISREHKSHVKHQTRRISMYVYT